MRKIEQISISAADRERLERLVRDRNTAQKVVWRARIVLLASDGLTAEAIAAAVGKSLLTVRRWRRRYVAKGVDRLLKDATRLSRMKPLSPEKIKQVVHMTLNEKPQCRPQALHLDQVCRQNPRKSRPRDTNVRVTTLVSVQSVFSLSCHCHVLAARSHRLAAMAFHL